MSSSCKHSHQDFFFLSLKVTNYKIFSAETEDSFPNTMNELLLQIEDILELVRTCYCSLTFLTIKYSVLWYSLKWKYNIHMVIVLKEVARDRVKSTKWRKHNEG